MKKKIVFMCMLALLFTTGMFTANAQKSSKDVLVTIGEITEVYEDKIEVVGEGSFDKVILNIEDTTYLLNGEEGTYITKEDLKVGQKVTAYYSSKTTRSIPPQSNAFAILVGEGLENGIFIKVDTVDKKDGVTVLNIDQDQYVSFPKGSSAYINDIKSGSDILTWYNVVAMSYPAQATSNEVILLTKEAKVKVHLLAGVVAINNVELLEGYIKENDKVMLPLESTARGLGYKVTRVDKRDAYVLEKGMFKSTVNLSDIFPSYVKLGSPVELSQRPIIKDGVVFVPVDYFTKVLGDTVQIINSNI